MVPTPKQLLAIGGYSLSTSIIPQATLDNINSLITSLGRYGVSFGLDLPHRLAHYLAQLGEESGAFKWDRELASGAAYEGRKDLGNTQPGDGVKFKGRTEIQVTGRDAARRFTLWCRENIDAKCPDFEANPDLMNTDPWEGLAPIWFWSTHKLNDYADENNIEQITKKINGGLNGFDVRVHFYVRAALVLIGTDPDNVVGFQKAAQLEGLLPPGADQLDGDAGPKTRAAMHQKLIELSPAWVTGNTKAAPVTEKIVQTVTKEVPVDKPVAVVAKGSDKRVWIWPAWLSTMGVAGLNAFMGGDWQTRLWLGGLTVAIAVVGLLLGDLIIRRVKTLRDEIGL